MPQPESILSMTLCVFAPLCEIPGFYARAGSSKGGRESRRRLCGRANRENKAHFSAASPVPPAPVLKAWQVFTDRKSVV